MKYCLQGKVFTITQSDSEGNEEFQWRLNRSIDLGLTEGIIDRNRCYGCYYGYKPSKSSLSLDNPYKEVVSVALFRNSLIDYIQRTKDVNSAHILRIIAVNDKNGTIQKLRDLPPKIDTDLEDTIQTTLSNILHPEILTYSTFGKSESYRSYLDTYAKYVTLPEDADTLISFVGLDPIIPYLDSTQTIIFKDYDLKDFNPDLVGPHNVDIFTNDGSPHLAFLQSVSHFDNITRIFKSRNERHVTLMDRGYIHIHTQFENNIPPMDGPNELDWITSNPTRSYISIYTKLGTPLKLVKLPESNTKASSKDIFPPGLKVQVSTQSLISEEPRWGQSVDIANSISVILSKKYPELKHYPIFIDGVTLGGIPIALFSNRTTQNIDIYGGTQASRDVLKNVLQVYMKTNGNVEKYKTTFQEQTTNKFVRRITVWQNNMDVSWVTKKQEKGVLINGKIVVINSSTTLSPQDLNQLLLSGAKAIFFLGNLTSPYKALGFKKESDILYSLFPDTVIIPRKASIVPQRTVTPIIKPSTQKLPEDWGDLLLFVSKNYPNIWSKIGTEATEILPFFQDQVNDMTERIKKMIQNQ